MRSNASRWQTAWWILFAFVVWVITFRGFLSSNFSLTSDALSYYEHTKFFIENLRAGIYPLWDPFWYFGAPNDFFLRRIGAFNPFYVTIPLIQSFGIPYTLSYLCFLAAYYWSGSIAFYLLTLRLYHNRLIAYAGYLMLLFSALGTRLFDSYMMLVTVPLIWFFYFLLAFSQTPRKNFFLGIILFFMILAGTYIPFYFLIIMALFSLLFLLIYFDKIPRLGTGYSGFFKENKILVVLSLLVVIFSFSPALNFFYETSHGHIALPLRHGGEAPGGQVLSVPHQTLDWGAIEDLMYSAYFSDLRLYKFAVVYVPFFSVILLFLGFIGRLSRRAAFLFLLGLVLFCCIVPHGLPFYDLFYRHLFFLKYFRNLHFFIWFFLIPLFILLALEHWDIYTRAIQTNLSRQSILLIYTGIIHLAAYLFVWWRHDAIAGTYLMITLSLIFWILMVLRQIKENFLSFALLTLTILVQPLEVYYYFSLKAEPRRWSYNYNFPYTTLKLHDTALLKPQNIPSSKPTLYYVSRPYDFIYQHISNEALAKYLQYKLLLVDHLQAVAPSQAAGILEGVFSKEENKAVIFNDTAIPVKFNGNDPHAPSKSQPIDENFKGFKLLSFNADHLSLLLDLPYEKFLIYNDSYDPYWRLSINRHRASIYEVNGAFKGTWVAAGKNIIEFDYGCWWQYVMNVLLSIIAFIYLAGIIYYACFP